MFFFDYIYYVACNYYKRFKEDREDGTWHASGVITVSGTLSLFCMLLQVISEQIFGYKDEGSMFLLWSTFAIFIFSLIFFIIRYNKFTSYKEIYFKIESMSKRKILVLNIISISYILLSFVGTFIAVVIVGGSK